MKIPGRASMLWLVALLGLPAPVHAHGIHPIWVVGALSPLVVLLLAALLGWLVRRARTGVIHAGLIVLWVALFWLASSRVTNDYIIWAPLAAYLLHSAVIAVLVLWHGAGRIRRRYGATKQ